jgi:hypothetical protein
MKLVHESKVSIPKSAQLPCAEAINTMPSERDVASGRLKEATQGLKQGAFTAAGGAGNRNTAAFVDLQVYTVENLDRQTRFGKCHPDILTAQDGRGFIHNAVPERAQCGQLARPGK